MAGRAISLKVSFLAPRRTHTGGRGCVKTHWPIKYGIARRGADCMKRFIEGADRTQVSLLP